MDNSTMRLGRKPPLPAGLTKRVAFKAVFGDDLPEPALTRDWTEGDKLRPLWANDMVGDCTAVTVANCIVGEAKARYGISFRPTTQDVIGLYEKTTKPPYDPSLTNALGENPTDTGAVFEDVLTYVLKNGFRGHHLIGSCAVDPSNVKNIKRTIDWFGAACLGLAMPYAWQKAGAWTLAGYSEADPAWLPSSWGGHEVCAEAYDENGVIVWSWGLKIYLTFEALAKYCDELDATIWASWIKSGMTPAGIDLSKLENYANAIKAS